MQTMQTLTREWCNIGTGYNLELVRSVSGGRHIFFLALPNEQLAAEKSTNKYAAEKTNSGGYVRARKNGAGTSLAATTSTVELGANVPRS